MNHIKKMIAGFLACWMLLSCCPSVFAAELRETLPAPDGAISGSVTSQATNVGGMPNDIICVVIPTNHREGDGAFNFIMDPTNLIKNSDAIDTRFDGAEFGPGRLFFKNTDEDGNVTGYSMDSDEIRIYNKSTCPLLLTMTVETTKGSNYQFAKTTDFKDENGRVIRRPALYLALVNGARRSPVLNLKADSQDVYQAKLKGWIEDPECYDVAWDSAANSGAGSFVYRLKEDVEDTNLPYTSFYMTGAINQADWGSVGDVTYTVTWAITKEIGPDENPIPDEDTDPSVIVLEPAAAIDDEVVLHFDFGWGEKEKDRLTKLIYKYNGVETQVNAGTGAVSSSNLFSVDTSTKKATIKAVTPIFKAKEWKLRFERTGVDPVDVPFDIMSAGDASNPSASIKSGTSGAKQIGDSVSLTLNYGKGDAMMSKVTRLKYRTATGVEKTIAAGTENFTVDGTEATVKAIKSAFEGSAWKVVFEDDGGGSYEAPVTLRSSSVTIRNVDPSIGKLTEEDKAHRLKDPVQMTFNLGSGTKYMTDVDRLEYKDHNGETTTVMAGTENVVVDNDASTITVTTVRDIYTGSDWNIVFVNKDDDAYTYAYVPVDLLADDAEEAVANEPPSVFVHQAAKLTYDTVKLTINWGAGEEAMSAVTAVKYERDTGRTLSMGIANADLNVDLETGQTTVVAIPVMFNGSNWRVVMTNDKGETTEVPFDLRHETPYDNEQGRDPSVRVATAASAANDWVELELDFGTQDKKMTQVNRFLYNRDNGNPLSMALTNPSLQVDLANGKVRIKASALILNGSNWRLELSNGDAHDAKVKEVSFDPKVAG